MMFKATKNQRSENFDRLTEDVGGANNAFTREDVTVYHETVPCNYLETLLWAEATASPTSIDEANFISERAVVEEEYRQSVLAPPYGRLCVGPVFEETYSRHRARISTFGTGRDELIGFAHISQ